MQVDVRQLVLAIGKAVDLVGIDDVLHGRRVAVIAVECARRLGWDDASLSLLFDAGVLHDMGVSSTRVHRTLVDELDWSGSHFHCEKGYELLRDFAPLSHLAPVIRDHHSHWDELVRTRREPLGAIHANLIYLADRVDVRAASFYGSDSLLPAVGGVRKLIAERRGTFFAPELVDAFLEASAPEAFWLMLTPEYVSEYVAEIERGTHARPAGYPDLKRFALIIADIVDAKSHFTKEHSLGVGRLARRLGSLCGFSGGHLDRIELAALLHDIGKLQVPDEVLESPGRLSVEERAVMMRHSFATYRILRRIGGFDEIARWASEHHESLGGGGYPFRFEGKEISKEARIIKVADIYQALAQERPYRKALPEAEIVTTLQRMAAENEVDPELVDLVGRNRPATHREAVGAAATA